MTNETTLLQIARFETALSRWDHTPPEGVSEVIHRANYDGLVSMLESLREELGKGVVE